MKKLSALTKNLLGEIATTAKNFLSDQIDTSIKDILTDIAIINEGANPDTVATTLVYFPEKLNYLGNKQITPRQIVSLIRGNEAEYLLKAADIIVKFDNFAGRWRELQLNETIYESE